MRTAYAMERKPPEIIQDDERLAPVIRSHGAGAHGLSAPELRAALSEAEDQVRRQRRTLDRAEADHIGLLKELNHRVQNNMQMLLSLLSSAARESDTLEARTALSDASRRVAVIGAAQQVLYGGDDVGTTYAAATLIRAVAAITHKNAAVPVALEVTGEEIVLSNDTAVPFALMLNELIANAERHGGRPGVAPTIRVDIERIGNGITVVVSDEGPGFVDDPSRGKRASGLGLVRGLARQLGGTLSVERANGARCVITFRDRSLH